MSKVLINPERLKEIADALREVTGSTDKWKPADMPAVIRGIETGTGETVDVPALMASIADGSYPWGDYVGTESVINSRMYSAQALASYSNTNLTSITQDGAFSFSRLVTFSAPNLETLSNKSAVFQYCQQLTSADLGKVTVLPASTFYGSNYLRAVPNADILTSVGQQCFSFNSTITDLDLAKVESIGPFAFAQCGNLRTIRLPSIINLTANIFNNSHKIEVADLGASCLSVTNSAFSGCRIELTLIMRATNPPTLNGSFMLGSGGAVISIRVPATSVDAYKAAANWSNYAPIISAI